MNSITKRENARWNPFKEMEVLSNGLISFLGNAEGAGNGNDQGTLSGWLPLVDITEDDHEYLIKAELPGVRKEDLKVTVENNVLTLTGERKLEKEEKTKRYHRVERAYGMFTRSFALPENTDSAKVNAEFRDGLLEVRLGKAEQAKPKTIEVKVS